MKRVKDRYLKGVYQKLPPNDMSLGRNYKWLDKNMLTPKQLKLLKYLKNYFKEHEYMPLFEEMKVYMNIKSKSGVYNMLGAMEYKGYIKRIPAQHRAIKIIEDVA